MSGILTRMHCTEHVDAQGEQVPCPGHYLRLGEPHRLKTANGHVLVVTPWEEVPR